MASALHRAVLEASGLTEDAFCSLQSKKAMLEKIAQSGVAGLS
jgi:hypothetical protein